MVKEVFVMRMTDRAKDSVAYGMTTMQMASMLVVMAALSLGMLWIMASASI